MLIDPFNSALSEALNRISGSVPPARVDHEPRFSDVACSQCGNTFGPGDSGFSSCSEHHTPPPALLNAEATIAEAERFSRVVGGGERMPWVEVGHLRAALRDAEATIKVLQDQLHRGS